MNCYTESSRTTRSHAGKKGRWHDSFVSLDALDSVIADIASQKLDRLTKQKASLPAKSEPILATKNDSKPQEILAPKKASYTDFRTAICAHHNEALLESIQPIVDHLRSQNINVICLPKYDLITYLATDATEGSFTTKASGQWDVVIDYDHCVRLAAVLGIGIDTALEAVLLHEAGHVLNASIKPEHYCSEVGAFAAGEVLRQRVGTISQQSYLKLWRFCIN